MMDRVESEEAEKEANYFAMHLLVPTFMLEEALGEDYRLDLTDDKRIKELAHLFQVSVTVMLFRIQELASTRKRTGK